jgi:hypothetical protein
MSGISAAPNRSTITGHVIGVEPSATSMGKWYLIVQIRDAVAIAGGLFARPGLDARVFTFGDAPQVAVGDVISAEVEYLGGPTGGEFQLLRLLGGSASEADTGVSSADAARTGPTDDRSDGG